MLRSDSRPQVDCSTVPSMTRQADKDGCDINKIMAQYRRTGSIAHLAKGVPQFMDVSEMGDFRETMEQIRKAEGFFAGLPAKVRDAFSNDVGEFLDAYHSSDGGKRLKDAGLMPEVVLEEKPVGV